AARIPPPLLPASHEEHHWSMPWPAPSVSFMRPFAPIPAWGAVADRSIISRSRWPPANPRRERRYEVPGTADRLDSTLGNSIAVRAWRGRGSSPGRYRRAANLDLGAPAGVRRFRFRCGLPGSRHPPAGGNRRLSRNALARHSTGLDPLYWWPQYARP